MSFSSISGSHTSSTLYPLSTSHLHPIRKPYEFPSFDPPPPPSSSSKSIQSNSLLSVIDERPSSSFYKFEDNVNDEIREGLERLDLARKREKNVIQSTSSSSSSSLPDIPLRKSTSTKHPQNFFPVSYSEFSKK